MPRGLLIAITVVAACQLKLAAAPASGLFDEAPVTGWVARVAETLGGDPAANRGRFLGELTRIAYSTAAERSPIIELAIRAAHEQGNTTKEPAILVPVPLAASIWSRSVFHRTIPHDQLVAAILSDRHAAL